MSLLSLIIIIAILAINYYLIFIKLNNKTLFYISSTMLIIFYIITIFIYNNNINNGFAEGIIYGDYYNNHFCDEYRYYIDSEILYNHFKNGDITNFITKNLPSYEFIDSSGHPGFGNYNVFVILLSFLRLLGLDNALDFITIKLVIFPLIIFYLYKLFTIFVSNKTSLLLISLVCIMPSFILSNTLLIRDNIIFLLIITLFYNIFSNKKEKLIIYISLFFLVLMRFYVLPILLVCYLITLKNKNKFISKIDLIFLLTCFIGVYLINFIDFTTDNSSLFGISQNQLRIIKENFITINGSGIMLPINFFASTILHIFYVPPFLNFLQSDSIYLILLSLGNIMSVFLSIIFIPSYLYVVYKNHTNSTLIHLLKITFYFIFMAGLVLTAKDGYIITRLSSMWLPLMLLIISIQYKKSKIS